MHFTEAGVEEFLGFLKTNKLSIRHFSGLFAPSIAKGAADPLSFSTLSHWDNQESLDQYRQSELFGKSMGSGENFIF